MTTTVLPDSSPAGAIPPRPGQPQPNPRPGPTGPGPHPPPPRLAQMRGHLPIGAHSAVQFPARQAAVFAHDASGGPSNHPGLDSRGEGLTPGLGSGICPSDNQSRSTPPGREAGASSGPRPVARCVSPDGLGREAGAGFSLPQAKRWTA